MKHVSLNKKSLSYTLGNKNRIKQFHCLAYFDKEIIQIKHSKPVPIKKLRVMPLRKHKLQEKNALLSLLLLEFLIYFFFLCNVYAGFKSTRKRQLVLSKSSYVLKNIKYIKMTLEVVFPIQRLAEFEFKFMWNFLKQFINCINILKQLVPVESFQGVMFLVVRLRNIICWLKHWR